MSNWKILIQWKDVLIFLLCIAASAFVFFSDAHEFNKMLFVLPFVFGLCYVFILAPLRVKTGSNTVLWFTIAEFIRLVFVPCFESVNDYIGFYGFSTEDSSLLLRAIVLMSYECIFISFFLFIALRNTKKELDENEAPIEPLGNDSIALVIVLLMGIVINLAVPEVKRTLNFLLLGSNASKIRALTTGSQSSLNVGLITFTYDAFLCGFIVALDYAKRKFTISGRKIYVFVAAIAGVITVSIINGESRSTTVYTLYAVAVSMGYCFPEYKKKITRVLLISAGVVLVGMTAYRLFSVYRYSSYGAALQGSSLRDNYISSFVEMYCLGPQSVACGIHFSDVNQGSFTLGSFFYDIFRPFMGLNFIAKLFDGKTSILMYNSWFSGVEGRSNGLFLQISNQGYCYFGMVLAPIYACLFLRIAIFLEKKLKQRNSLFLIFFYNYVYIRLATCVIAGTMSGYITTITMVLLVCGAIYLLQKFISSVVVR